MRCVLSLVLTLLFVTSLAHAGTGPTPGPIARYTTTGDFETIAEDVGLAIQNRGLLIDHVSHIHEMLERTGKDLGASHPLYRAARTFSFCSAVVSRKMMTANPHHIAFCPFVITVYVPVNEPNRVYVAYRCLRPLGHGPANRAALKNVDDLLDDIVREALNLK